MAKGQVAVGSEGTKKPVLIGIAIIVVLLVVVGGFLLFMKPGQTAGKAIDFGGSAEVPLETLIQDGYEGGVEEPLVVPFKEFQIITIPVWGLLRSGEETVSYDFTLEYDSKVLQFIQADSALLSDWGGDFWDVRHTDGNKVSVAHANLNYKNSLKGKLQNGETGDRGYRLATVTFKVVNPDPTTVDNVDVLYVDFTGPSSAVSPIAKQHKKVLVYDALPRSIVDSNEYAFKMYFDVYDVCKTLTDRALKNNKQFVRVGLKQYRLKA